MTYKFDGMRADGTPTRCTCIGKIQTERSSYKTLEKAIEKAMFFIEKKEWWIDTTVLKAEIVNKETGEQMWRWEA